MKAQTSVPPHLHGESPQSSALPGLVLTAGASGLKHLVFFERFYRCCRPVKTKGIPPTFWTPFGGEKVLSHVDLLQGQSPPSGTTSGGKRRQRPQASEIASERPAQPTLDRELCQESELHRFRCGPVFERLVAQVERLVADPAGRLHLHAGTAQSRR